MRYGMFNLRVLLLGVAAHIAAGQSLPDRWIAAGHWKRARAAVEERFREHPDDALSNFLMSQIRNAFGDRKTPLPLAEKAVALDGRTARYHRQLAEALGVAAQHSNLVQQALLAHRFRREIDRALALDARDVQAWRDLLEYYLLAPGIVGGDKTKARETADRIAALDASEGWVARARIAQFKQDSRQQEEMLRQACEAQPPSYRARIELAEFYLAPARRQLEGAEQQARAALALDAGRVAAYAILAAVYAARERWAELESTLAAAEAAVPDDLTPYYRAAASLLAAGRDRPRAGRYLRKYLTEEPEGNEPTAAEAKRMLAGL